MQESYVKTVVLYIQEHKQRFNAETLHKWTVLVSKNLPNVSYQCLPTIESVFACLSDPFFHVDYIVLDVEFLEKNSNGIDPYTLVTTLKTLANNTICRNDDGETKKRQVKLLGIVGYNSPVNYIKDMIELVDGLILRVDPDGPWTLQMVLEDQLKIQAGDFSIPNVVKNMIRKNKPRKRNNVITLTPRQKEVLHMVSKRGVSNKVIAKTLNISESTVKLHIGNILKKYGLKNRTQLVVFVKN